MTAAAAPPAREQHNQLPDGDDSDDSEESAYDFIDVTCSSSRGAEATYHSKVGMQFVDIDDDRLYQIDSVCREDVPGRRVSFAQLFFRYHAVDTPNVFEYTPCMEVINSSWCEWQQTPSAAARVQRAARRMRSKSPEARVTRSRG